MENEKRDIVNLDLSHLIKLRLCVARFGEMDGAGWWNTQGILGKGGRAVLSRNFPVTHGFAQARIACSVAAVRCASVFAPPGCWTLWTVPAEIEDALARQWTGWCRLASDWTPFFDALMPRNTGDLLQHLSELKLIDDSTVKATASLRRSAEGKAVPLPGMGHTDIETLMLLAAGFSRGEKQKLAVPYIRAA